jgi:hypothetical protein
VVGVLPDPAFWPRIAPEVAPDGSAWTGRLVLAFAFAQSVHYSIWLRLIPDEDRDRPTPRTFAASFRALRTDFGAPLLVGAILAALAVAGWSVFALIHARTGYLRAALFHGYLEYAAVALALLEQRRPNGAARSP